jgi:hypothetical protein
LRRWSAQWGRMAGEAQSGAGRGGRGVKCWLWYASGTNCFESLGAAAPWTAQHSANQAEASVTWATAVDNAVAATLHLSCMALDRSPATARLPGTVCV